MILTVGLHETKECLELMAKFFDQKLARQN